MIVNCALMQPEADEVEGEEAEAEAAEGALEEGFGAVGLKKLTVFVKKTVEFVLKKHTVALFFLQKTTVIKKYYLLLRKHMSISDNSHQ